MPGKAPPGSSALDQLRLKDLGAQALDLFGRIAGKARVLLDLSDRPVPDALTHQNTIHRPGAAATLVHIVRENRETYRHLTMEPAIARVVAQDDEGRRLTYYITRFTPVQVDGTDVKVVGYRAPLGRLASLPLGIHHTIATPSGALELEIVERSEFHPRLEQTGWESLNTRVLAEDGSARTILSLRALLSAGIATVEEVKDLLTALLNQAKSEDNVVEGFRRGQLRRVSLRENPILDEFQDEAFRLPLASRLVLIGPPGSGKTTTLIKRLGQKLDTEALDEAELRAVGRTRAGLDGHATSWLMFSPTDLLKAYVKEAFNEEGIPAPDTRIQTWTEYRLHLGRHELPILRTATRPVGFVLRDRLENLQPAAIEDSTSWFTAFEAWQQERFWSDLRAGAQRLAEDSDMAVNAIGARLLRLMVPPQGEAHPPLHVLLDMRDGIAEKLTAIRTQADSIIRKAANVALHGNRRFFDEFGTLLAGMKDTSGQDPDGADDEDDEDMEEAPAGVGELAAVSAYFQAVRGIARAASAKRRLKAGTRTARLAHWLKDRIPPRAELETLGRALETQTAIRRFTNPARRYLLDTPRRYARFRREAEDRAKWYRTDQVRITDLSPLELDVIILAMLDAAGRLVAEPRLQATSGEPGFEFLSSIRNLWQSQIVVDEATDFSPVQLACMSSLCDPALNSFLACGDFNQRLTRWGTRSAEDLEFVFPDIETREITVTYRHSRQLNEFAARIAALTGDEGPAAGLPEHVENEGVPPVCGFRLADSSMCAAWLAARIVEIEKLSDGLPTVAVLVSGEDAVRPLADALNDALEENNIRAVACPEGKFVGQDNEVRVFDIQHIKGLEFEAVFFVGIDQLAEDEPELFGKYLYVGATRAATYLGMTSSGGSLPLGMIALSSSFQQGWST
jgi:hypothetical protein